MEPRSFKRGNQPQQAPAPHPNPRFNGATFFQTWKQLRAERGTSSRRMASMEPRSFKRGNLLAIKEGAGGQKASMEPRSFKRGNRRFSCFRTALASASMEPRSFKRGNVESGRNVQVLRCASMEPRSFKRGNPRASERGAVQRRGFNGATFFQTWKRGTRQAEYLPQNQLQWSHVLSNVETCIA